LAIVIPVSEKAEEVVKAAVKKSHLNKSSITTPGMAKSTVPNKIVAK
jgi:hypothetical protein